MINSFGLSCISNAYIYVSNVVGEILYFFGVMAEVGMFKKFDFLFSFDMSYLNKVL
jgi:hypothetical protein